MAKGRASAATGGTTGRLRDEWREMLPFAALFGAVVGVLILGAVLQTDSPGPATGEVKLEAPSTTRIPLRADLVEVPTEGGMIRPAPGPATAGANDLVRRVEGDLRRLQAGGGEWTVQVALACDPAGARDWLARFGDDGRLHMLPKTYNDESCFIFVWDRFRSRDAAAAPEALPRDVREFAGEGLFPKRVSDCFE